MRPFGRSPPPGRFPSLLLVLSHILLFALLINTHHNAIAHASPTPTSIVDTGPTSSSSFSSSTHAITTSAATTSTHKITRSTSTASRSLAPAPPPIVSTKTSTAQPTSSPFLPKRCKNCPPNNNLGQTCFKNTICVPLNLLCDIGYLTNTTVSTNSTNSTNSTTGLNQCMDVHGPASESDPFTCQGQLCYSTNFLPLPSPGKGTIDRNSSTTCMDGNYFSLYGSSDKGGAMRYTQSCVPLDQPSSPTTPVCNDWEYPAQSSCLLKTCGPYLDCEPPWECKKSTINGVVATYGLCMSANSTADPDGDDDGDDTSHERMLIGVLVGVCSLVLGVGVGTAVCHYRKKRMRQMETQNSVRNDVTLNQKSSLMTTLHTYFDACCCCFYGHNVELRRDGLDAETASEGGAQDPRVLSVAEPEIQASLNSSHRSNLIFARRWLWGAGRNADGTPDSRIGLTAGGVTVLPENEPPPMYHQGPDLPSYRDRNSIPLTSVTRPTSVTDQSSPERSEAITERITPPTPK